MKKRSQAPPAPAGSETKGPVNTQQPQQAIARRDRGPFHEWMEAHGKTLPPSCTLLELVHIVNGYTASDVETVALVTYLINSGRVRLRGTFAGMKISFSRTRAPRNGHGAPHH